nr:hypothetical protein [Methanosarcina horonobensis]
MNEHGLSEREVFSYLENAKSEDTDYYRVLSSMCTHPHKIAVEAHRLFIEANLGDLGFLPEPTGLSRRLSECLGNFFMLLQLIFPPETHAKVLFAATLLQEARSPIFRL